MNRGKNFFIILFVLICVLHRIVGENEGSDEGTDDGYSIADDCCIEGEEWMETGCEPPPDPSRTPGCLKSGQECCKNMIEDAKKCTEGIQQAKEKNNCDDAEEKSINCCEECRIGITLNQGGTGDCGIPSKNAFYICCEFAKTLKDITTTEKEPKVSSTTPENKHLDRHKNSQPDLNSCELEGDEMCAHKCIPTASSYKCQCRTGFKLRSDGHSCQKMDVNRCARKNPCDHKCMDTGDAVVCSCRRGFELMADNTSCIDVDECDLHIHNCKPGLKCINTPGSHRCVNENGGNGNTAKGNCPSGFALNAENQVCDDVDECKQNPCPSDLVCVNTIGSFSCGHSPGAPSRPAPPSPVDPRPIAAPYPSSDSDACPPGFKLDTENGDCKDIDECAEGTDDCNRKSQFCLNTHGTFTCQNKASKTSCPAGFKITPDYGCDDIDECAENPDICTPDSVCVNEPGGYACKARSSPGGRQQQPIPRPQPPSPQQPQIVPGVPRPPPTPRPEVTPTKKTFKGPPNSGSCPKGYRRSYNGGCADVDECAEKSHSCDDFQDCVNIMGGHRCVCKRGFLKDPITQACIDINECQRDELNDCTTMQRCDNTIGSYHCVRYLSCGTGYTLNSISSTCEDDDECALGTHDCGQMGALFECTNLPGTYRCVRKELPSTSSIAPPGYDYSDEFYPDNEEEYSEVPKPLPKKITSNVQTHPSQQPRPRPIEPSENSVDEPTTPPAANYDEKQHRQPDPRSQVSPTYPQPQPERSNQPDTQDRYPEVDERDKDNENPKPQVYYPRPKYPNRPLEEPPEYRPAEPRIEHIPVSKTNEKPVTYVGNQDSDGSIVLDTNKLQGNTWTRLVPGKNCIPGYVMDTRGDCIDIDECATGRYVCSPDREVCRNILGAYECICAPGYSKDPKTRLCLSRNEVSPPAPVVPIWSHGQTKTCDTGFQLDLLSRQCIDIDECSDGSSRCSTNELCVNTRGGFRCQCSPGHVLSGERCVLPTQPPAPRPKPPVRVVTVTSPPRYNYCTWGYQLENNRCVDVDECLTGKHSCQQNQRCVNIPGGYLCQCEPGHRLSKQGGCQDVDECVESGGKVCSHYSKCINTIGSFQCECHKGFTTSPMSKQLCTDIDECLPNNGLGSCHQKCVNSWGSHRCACNRGYRMMADNRTCVDLDECSEPERRLCVGTCQNTPGSYECTCPPGYKMGTDKRSCIDIDECETGETVCGRDHVCQNTRGGARCNSIACPPGYNRDENSKNRCNRPVGNCKVTDYSCLHQPITYSFNFITFVSKLYIPPGPKPQVDLFTMKGPTWPGSMLSFQLRLVDVRCPPGVPPATIEYFKLTPAPLQAMVSLVKPLVGPQDIHLELSMEVYRVGNYEGTAIAKIVIFVSEYEF